MTEQMQMIADCENRESRLSDWERDFLDNISNQLGRGARLTPRQISTLDEIWERVTADG